MSPTWSRRRAQTGRSAAGCVAGALACIGIVAGVTALLGADSIHKPVAAYFQGRSVDLTPAPGRHKQILVVGDAVLGPLVRNHKPNDGRPNLYVFAPGEQHRTDPNDAEPIDFNLILSSLPPTARTEEWDVYWALVLDPAVDRNLTSENALLYATQDGFSPGKSFSFDEVPASGVLRAYLHIDSMEKLEQQFRRPDGTLPRLVIVPANFAVRASAIDPDAKPACEPPHGRLSRALSVFTHGCRQPKPADEVKQGVQPSR